MGWDTAQLRRVLNTAGPSLQLESMKPSPCVPAPCKASPLVLASHQLPLAQHIPPASNSAHLPARLVTPHL